MWYGTLSHNIDQKDILRELWSFAACKYPFTELLQLIGKPDSTKLLEYTNVLLMKAYWSFLKHTACESNTNVEMKTIKSWSLLSIKLTWKSKLTVIPKFAN